jgi:hypothetical protein
MPAMLPATGGDPLSQRQVEVGGTLQPDGTLLLDEKPGLPPGRVRVVLTAVPPRAPAAETLVQFVERSRRELQAAGSRFMDEQELNAHLEWLRQGDRIDDLLRQADQGPQRQE